MSLERVDVRFKLPADTHAALRIICDARGCEIQEFVEALVSAEIDRCIRQANVIVRALQRRGISGNGAVPLKTLKGKPGSNQS